MAYERVRIDLRTKFYRRKKVYWRGIREGRLPWPKYEKPRLFRVKLDPEQAIITTCKAGPSAWIGFGTRPDVCVRVTWSGAGPICTRGPKNTNMAAAGSFTPGLTPGS